MVNRIVMLVAYNAGWTGWLQMMCAIT